MPNIRRMIVAVTGAGGFIGEATVKEMIRRDLDVVAIVRPGSMHRPTHGKIVQLDVLNVKELTEVFSGCLAVVHLAAVTSSSRRSVDTFKVNVAGSHAVASAARAAGVEKFIYLGSQAANEGAYATTKRKAEAAIRMAGIEPILLRPSLVYGPGDRGLFARIVEFVRVLPVVPLIGGGRYPMRPIHVDDVAAAIVGAIGHGTPGSCYDLSGGSEILFHDLLVAIGEAIGQQPRLVHVPPAPVLALSVLASRLWAGFPLSPDMIRGLTNPVVLDGRSAECALGFRSRTIEEGLRDVVA
jgi:nucleoside-diphosphate-sugar epimerase